ncbi:hypothetical protein K2P47_04995 [Patescibacteria group bacterium]|nr:hypothetical protein [Patescibacteria group bacterium]
MTNINQLTIQISTHLQTLKQELDRLAVRQSALVRFRASVLAGKSLDASDEENDEVDEIIAHVEAVESDLVTFKAQMHERLNHARRGAHLASLYAAEKNASLLYQHVLDGLVLCVADAATARAGYDELIENLKEMSHLHDV